MARKARNCPAGTLQHIISRFLDREFRFVDDTDRMMYLRFLEPLAERSDWHFWGYSLMSSHVHLPCLTGTMELQDLFGPLHTRFAQYWHRRHGGLGAVFADRPANHPVRSERWGELIAYNHMDPVRNNVVAHPAESRWTSHRIYLRLDPAPSWLDVGLGLALCGFSDTEPDRQRFDDFVQSVGRRHWQNDVFDEPTVPLRWDPKQLVKRTTMTKDVRLDDLMAPICKVAGVTPAAVLSGARTRSVVKARRIAARIAFDFLGMKPAEIARRLGVTSPAIGHLLQHVDLSDFATTLEQLGLPHDDT